MKDMPNKSSGSYQATEGLSSLRQNAADYVTKRDGYEASAGEFYFSNGATEAIMTLLRPIIRGPTDAILCPRPGFPMYNATIVYYGGTEITYDLDEEMDWGMS